MDEKAKQCYLASFDGTPGAQRNPTNFQCRDDGSHFYPSKDNFLINKKVYAILKKIGASWRKIKNLMRLSSVPALVA
jgi:hypothetical protein